MIASAYHAPVVDYCRDYFENCRTWGLKYRVAVRAPWQMWWKDAGTRTLTDGLGWMRWWPCWRRSTHQKVAVWYHSISSKDASHASTGTTGLDETTLSYIWST